MSEKIFICGASGWGKSTLARELTRGQFRRITIDPSGDWQRKGVKPVKSLQEVSQVIAQRWRDGFQMVYTPPTGKEAHELHRLSLLVFGYQEGKGLYKGRASDELMIVVEEMAEAYSNAHQQRADLTGFRRVILQGRHYGISVCGISQRPQDVSALFRDMADQKFAFALHSDTGRDAAVAMFGRAHARSYDSLARYEYLGKRDGVVMKGKTRRA